jgi:hypothetical protein
MRDRANQIGGKLELEARQMPAPWAESTYRNGRAGRSSHSACPRERIEVSATPLRHRAGRFRYAGEARISGSPPTSLLGAEVSVTRAIAFASETAPRRTSAMATRQKCARLPVSGLVVASGVVLVAPPQPLE